jgi:hypothetical protein
MNQHQRPDKHNNRQQCNDRDEEDNKSGLYAYFFSPLTPEEVQVLYGSRSLAEDDDESAFEVYTQYGHEASNLSQSAKSSQAKSQESSARPMLLEDFVKLDRVSQMVKATCCHKVDEPMLCQEVGKGEPPKLLPWICTHGYCNQCELFKRGCQGPRPADPCTHAQCEHCGVDKLLWKVCPLYQESEVPVKVLVWGEAERQGTDKAGSQNTQVELTEKELPFHEVVRLLNDNLERCRRHYGHEEWMRITKNIDTGWIDRDSLLILLTFPQVWFFELGQHSIHLWTAMLSSPSLLSVTAAAKC